MQRIIVIGAGRSTESLLKYLGENAERKNWHITIADKNKQLADSKAFNDRMTGIELDISGHEKLKKAIEGNSLVVSMLPAHLHGSVARECV